MTRYGGMGRTRPKKLTSKASIPVVREDQIDVIEEDIQAALQQVETGVEKAEETVCTFPFPSLPIGPSRRKSRDSDADSEALMIPWGHYHLHENVPQNVRLTDARPQEIHLQAAINAVALGKVSEANIPTPETVLSSIRYDELYPPTFSQPATYIRFSSTVEDCCGCPYNLVEEDDVFLKMMNEKRDPSTRCSENQFEIVMQFFEETAQAKQPFAAVDNPPVLSYAEIEESFDAAVEEGVRRFARDIYEHWKSRRLTTGNQPLQPALKVSQTSVSVLKWKALSFCSSRLDKKPMMEIHTCVSVDAKFARFAKRVVEMHRVLKNCGGFVKSWRMLASSWPLCDNANWPERKCCTSNDKSSSNGPKSRT
jgi:enhancer of polycomb-like protein